jgi:hypothetical protein
VPAPAGAASADSRQWRVIESVVMNRAETVSTMQTSPGTMFSTVSCSGL